MQTVVFVAPFFAETTLRFLEAAAEHPGTHTVLITQEPKQRLSESLRSNLANHLQVANALDAEHITQATAAVASRSGGVDRLLGVLEQLQVPLAVARERLGIPGMGVEAAKSFRDKARMKTVLQRAGIPCARHRRLESTADARAFAEEVGFPLVVKPLDGAGSRGTHTVDSAAELEQILQESPARPERPLLAEEFMRGEEHSFDGVSIDGQLVWHSLTRYHPQPLDAVENPWIQWCILLPREVDHPHYDDIRQVASASLDALGMDTGVSHMEWFRRPDGSVAVSEVGARPGGVQISRLISYAHDIDWHRAWARLMIDHEFSIPERRYAVGAAFLRAQGPGRRVKRILGLEQAQEELGPLVVDTALPRPGQPRSSSYEGEGFIVLRHRETRVVEKALARLITTVRVETD